jgi:hypothetical protein
MMQSQVATLLILKVFASFLANLHRSKIFPSPKLKSIEIAKRMRENFMVLDKTKKITDGRGGEWNLFEDSEMWKEKEDTAVWE